MGALIGPRPAAATTWAPDGIWSWGHSFTMDSYPYAPGEEYVRKVGTALGVPASLRGVSGSKFMDTCRLIVAPQVRNPTTGALTSNGSRWVEGVGRGQHVIMLENVHNDEAATEGGTAAYQVGYGLALRLSLAAFGAKSKILASTATRTGTWTATSYPDRVPGGVLYGTSQQGASMSFTVTGDECTIATAACDSAYMSYGTFRIEVDGTVVGYYNGTGKMCAYTNTVDHTTLMRWSSAGLRIAGMNAVAGTNGSKTLSIHKSAADGLSIFVSAVYLPADDPPRVFVGIEPPRNPDATNQTLVANFAANDAAYRTLIQEVCADYSYVTVVDLAPGWDNETMVATGVDPQNFHPNAAGMDHLAAAFTTAIQGS